MLKFSETANKLMKARALVEDERHWRKGSLGDPAFSPMCMIGALLFSGAENIYDSTDVLIRKRSTICRNALRGVIRRLFHERIIACPIMLDPIVFFNDHRQTTHADVLRVFDEAIALVE